MVGGFDAGLRTSGPTLVGEGVIGGSSPSSRGFSGGVFITLLRKSYGFSFRSFSSSIIGERLLLLLLQHNLLASGVERLLQNRPLDEVEGGKGREVGGAFDPAVLPPERGGEWRQTGVLPPLPGSFLIMTSSNLLSEFPARDPTQGAPPLALLLPLEECGTMAVVWSVVSGSSVLVAEGSVMSNFEGDSLILDVSWSVCVLVCMRVSVSVCVLVCMCVSV